MAKKSKQTNPATTLTTFSDKLDLKNRKPRKATMTMDLHGSIKADELRLTKNLAVLGNTTLKQVKAKSLIVDDLMLNNNFDTRNLVVHNNLAVVGPSTFNEIIANKITAKELNVELPVDQLIVNRQSINDQLIVLGDAALQSLTVNNEVIVEKDVDVHNNLTVEKDIHVHHNISVEKDIHVHHNISVEKDVMVQNNVHIHKDLMVEGDCQLKKIETHDLTIHNHLLVNGEATINKLSVEEVLVNNNLEVNNIRINNNLTAEGDISVNNFHARHFHADIVVIPYGTPDTNTPGLPGQIMHDTSNIYIFTQRKRAGVFTGSGQWERATLGEYLDYDES